MESIGKKTLQKSKLVSYWKLKVNYQCIEKWWRQIIQKNLSNWMKCEYIYIYIYWNEWIIYKKQLIFYKYII